MSPLWLYCYGLFYFLLIPLILSDFDALHNKQLENVVLGLSIGLSLVALLHGRKDALLGVRCRKKVTERVVKWRLKILFLISIFSFFTLYLLSGLDIRNFIYQGLEFRFYYTKGTDGFRYLLFYLPITLLYYCFCMRILAVKSIVNLESIIHILTALMMMISMGQRGVFIPFLVFSALYVYQKFSLLKYFTPLIVFSISPILLWIIGYTGILRFGIIPDLNFMEIIVAGTERFKVLIPNYYIFFDYWEENLFYTYGSHYLALMTVIVPSSIIPFEKLELSEQFFNRTFDVASNTGTNYGALPEFLINFSMYGLFLLYVISYYTSRVLYGLYYASKHLGSDALYYGYFCMHLLGFTLLGGISRYNMIMVPFVIFLFYVCNKCVVKSQYIE